MKDPMGTYPHMWSEEESACAVIPLLLLAAVLIAVKHFCIMKTNSLHSLWSSDFVAFIEEDGR